MNAIRALLALTIMAAGLTPVPGHADLPEDATCVDWHLPSPEDCPTDFVGTVTNAATGAPVTNVYVTDGRIGTFVLSDGTYRLSHKGFGVYTIRTSTAKCYGQAKTAAKTPLVFIEGPTRVDFQLDCPFA